MIGNRLQNILRTIVLMGGLRATSYNKEYMRSRCASLAFGTFFPLFTLREKRHILSNVI